MPVKIERTETVIKKRVVISEKMIREAFSIPKGAKVFIKIPSGGDYSGMDLDVDEILVTWTEKT